MLNVHITKKSFYKRWVETYGDDRYIYGMDCADGFTDVYLFKTHFEEKVNGLHFSHLLNIFTGLPKIKLYLT